jgi:hypothetical protein
LKPRKYIKSKTHISGKPSVVLAREPPLDGPKQAGVMPLDLVHGWISAQVTPLNVKNRTNRIAFLSFNASAMKSNTFL